MLRSIAALLVGLLLCAQTPMLPGFPPGTFQSRDALDAASIATPLSLDGSVSGNNFGAIIAGLTVILSTTSSNDVIVIFVLTNGGPILSATGGTIGAFTKRASAGIAPITIEEWYAIAPSPLSSESIVIVSTISGACSAMAFGVNGAKTSAPFDVNGSLPNTGTTDPATVSTTAANTMVLGGFRMNSISTPTAGAGFTGVAASGAFMLAEYKIVSAAQSGLSVTLTTGAGDANSAIGDAIVQGP